MGRGASLFPFSFGRNMKTQFLIYMLLASQFAAAQFYHVPLDISLSEIPYSSGGLTDRSYGISFINDSTGFRTITRGWQFEGPIWRNYILKTTDFAESWDTVYVEELYPINANEFRTFSNIEFVNDTLGFVCGWNMFAIMRTSDGGSTWQDISAPAQNLIKIQFYDHLRGVCVPDYGGFGSTIAVETYDGGLTWTEATSFQNDNSFISECEVVSAAVADLHNKEECYTDQFEEIEFPIGNQGTISRQPREIAATSTDHWTVGTLGNIGFSNFASLATTWNGGDSYEYLDFSYVPYIGDILYLNDSVAYGVAARGQASVNPLQDLIWKTLDGGHTWSAQEIIPELILESNEEGDYYRTPNFSDIECPSECTCYLYGLDLYRTNNGGGELFPNQGVVLTSVNEIEEGVEIEIYPNPAHEKLNIKSKQVMVSVQIVNSLGQIVISSNRHENTTSKTLDISLLESGIFFIIVQSEIGNSVQRFVKVR